jgi:hypothetical protein
MRQECTSVHAVLHFLARAFFVEEVFELRLEIRITGVSQT